MIGEDVFGVDPWSIPEHKLDLELLAQTESIFALSNGHFGLRGNLDEGEPSGRSGTFLNGFHETRPLPYAEAGYGDPESGETMINVTNGKVLRLLVDDEPFDLRYGTLEHHERVLDLRSGVLRREVRWLSPAGQGVILRTTRLVSFVQRAVAAIEYEVEPFNGNARIVVQSELIANEPVPETMNDPRAAAALRRPLQGEFHGHHKLRAGLVHVTRASQLRVAAGMDHVVGGPREIVIGAESEKDLARVTFTTDLHKGDRLRIVKFLAYGWSSRRSVPAMRDQTDAALAAAMHTGWDGLVASQRAYMDDFWAGADIELEGDPALQQAMRFALVLGSAVRRARRGPRDWSQGVDRPRLRRPLVLGHGDVHAARAHLCRARGRARRAAVAPLDARARAGARAGAGRRWRDVPVAHDLRQGVLGLLARRHGRVSHQRRHRRRGPALHRRNAGRERSSAAKRSSCSSRPPGYGARSATTTRRATSASTVSRGPTSTRRSPTTTCTRT